MAGHGPAPKDPDRRARRNKQPATINLTQDGKLRGPTLPRGGYKLALKDGVVQQEWPEATKRWWTNWRKSAQAQTFNDSDWDFLFETAVLHAQFWNGDSSVAAELRLRVAKFGATPEDRLRLRMSIKPAEDDQEETPQAAPVSSRARYGDLRVVS